MTTALLAIHVIAAILAVGPIAVAASLFPRAVTTGDAAESGTVRFLHRTCRVYAVVGVSVPVFGIATGASMGVLGDAWLGASIVLTVVAAGVLGLAILPGQRRLLAMREASAAGETVAPQRLARRLTMLTGTFNLLWAVVVVLMIARPGSTTGV